MTNQDSRNMTALFQTGSSIQRENLNEVMKPVPSDLVDEVGTIAISYILQVPNPVLVCPGIPFAERTLWINIAAMLWTFDICPSKEVDPRTGLLFQYDDSDAAFNGDVCGHPS